jgi:hypothetical protein
MVTLPLASTVAIMAATGETSVGVEDSRTVTVARDAPQSLPAGSSYQLVFNKLKYGY